MSESLYVWKCGFCGTRGEVYLPDGHDGDYHSCEFCGEEVRLELDGGVSLASNHLQGGRVVGRPRKHGSNAE